MRPASTASRMARAIHTGSLAVSDPGVHQHRGGAEFHGHRRIAGRADARVDDHRNFDGLHDDAQVRRVADAHARADWSREGHHCRAAHGGETLAGHRIVGDVGEHGEAVVEQHLRSLEGRGDVGEEGALVADHLELHQLGVEEFASESRGGDGLVGTETPGGVRQDLESDPV